MTTNKKIDQDIIIRMCFKKDNYHQLTKEEINNLNKFFFEIFLYDIAYKTELIKFNYNVTNMVKYFWLTKQAEQALKPKEIEGLLKTINMFHLLVNKYGK